METGPRATSGFDLALTELLDGEPPLPGRGRAASAGAEVLAEIGAEQAEQADEVAAAAVSERARVQMGRELETDGIKELLYRNIEHPRWDEVSERCLTCGNCTMVCPTCFCTTVEDVTDLAGRGGRAGPPVGLLLHARVLLHPRRQRAQQPARRATASG